MFNPAICNSFGFVSVYLILLASWQGWTMEGFEITSVGKAQVSIMQICTQALQ